MLEILNALKGKDIYLFGTSPQINKLIEPLEVISNTYIKQSQDKSCEFSDLQIKIDDYKLGRLHNKFKDKFGNKVTIGLNLFSSFFPVDIALWIDSTPWLTREILNNSQAKAFCTTPEIRDLSYRLNTKRKVTKIYDWAGKKKDHSNVNEVDETYSGALWCWRSVITTAIHLCALAKAKNVYIVGVDLNPLIPDHFYETVNIGKSYGFVNESVIIMLDQFQKKFPDTKFWKTSANSFLPFEFKDILNG